MHAGVLILWIIAIGCYSVCTVVRHYTHEHSAERHFFSPKKKPTHYIYSKFKTKCTAHKHTRVSEKKNYAAAINSFYVIFFGLSLHIVHKHFIAVRFPHVMIECAVFVVFTARSRVCVCAAVAFDAMVLYLRSQYELNSEPQTFVVC